MPETPPPLPEPDVPEAVARKPSPRSLQVVWIIPILAAIVGGWLAVKSLFLDRGPHTTIRFESGGGREAGKTRIKYKTVDIGIVHSIELPDDRQYAIVNAELARRGSRGFLAEDTKFWIV